MNITSRLVLAAACLCVHVCVRAEPLLPQDDAQVVEVLPAVSGSRADEKRLRREWAANPADERAAIALARHELERARTQGDPRRAGQALAALQAWPNAVTAPDEVLLLQATIEQYLHDFETSATHLERLVHRRPLKEMPGRSQVSLTPSGGLTRSGRFGGAKNTQAWLTLATVRRVQGRYAQSNEACAALGSAGAWLYAQACRAENDGLHGDFEHARMVLGGLLGAPRLDVDTKNWLWTTRAELEARAGRPAQAEAAYRSALAAQHDGYTVLSFADFLILQSRDADALALLAGEPRSDAVLLRLAIAGTRAKSQSAVRDAQDMRERVQQASLRPGALVTHAREQAMFALWVDDAPRRALQFARSDLRHQREALDLMVFAQAARAAGEPAALREVESIRKDMGLRDERLEALL